MRHMSNIELAEEIVDLVEDIQAHVEVIENDPGHTAVSARAHNAVGDLNDDLDLGLSHEQIARFAVLMADTVQERAQEVYEHRYEFDGILARCRDLLKLAETLQWEEVDPLRSALTVLLHDVEGLMLDGADVGPLVVRSLVYLLGDMGEHEKTHGSRFGGFDPVDFASAALTLGGLQ